MVAQHDPVAPQRADRVFQIELHKPAVARHDRAGAEHRGTADDVLGAEMHVHRQAVAQRRGRRARYGEPAIDAAGRRMQRCGDHPVAAPRLAAFREIAGHVQRAAFAGGGPLDRPVVRVDAAHPQFDPARAQHQMIAGRRSAGRHGAGHDEPNAGQRKGAVDRHAELTRRRAGGARRIGCLGGLAEMLG